MCVVLYSSLRLHTLMSLFAQTACECVLAAPFADDALLLMQPAIKSLLVGSYNSPNITVATADTVL